MLDGLQQALANYYDILAIESMPPKLRESRPTTPTQAYFQGPGRIYNHHLHAWNEKPILETIAKR